MNRGADRQDIFSNDDDRLLFERLLADATDDHAIEVHAYCLMTNHFHLLVHCRGDGLSDAMQHVCGNHARAYNQRHGRSGPVFGDRFKSVPVTSDAQIITTARYIHRNPLDMVALRALGAYRWSSLGPYLGYRPPPGWLTTDVLGRLTGGCKAHRALVETTLPTDLTPAHGIPARTPPTLEQVEIAVAREIGSATEAMRQPQRGRPRPGRMLVLAIAVELRLAPVDVLADRYGLRSAAAVRVTARRGRVRLHDDPSFRQLHDRVVGQLLRGV